jgi:uncharacterized SAM-binding protein YcdF (DUF218 family)
MKGRWRRLLVGLLLCAAALALLWAARAPLLRAAGRWLDIGRPPRRAEYIMLLNGDESTRPFAAAALANAHWARRVLIAETAPTPDVIDHVRPPYHEINRQVLLKRGVPAANVAILPGQAATTHDEAMALAAFLERHPQARVLVVTSDYHTRRSRWVFARALADRAGQVSFVSAPSDEFNIDGWWQDQWGLVAIASEYLKLAFYAACYGYLLHWLAACVGLAIVIRWVRHYGSAPDASRRFIAA